MKVTTWINFDQEVDVEVSADEIIAALIGGTSSGQDVLRGLNNAVSFLVEIPDKLIAEMKVEHRDVVALRLREQAGRF